MAVARARKTVRRILPDLAPFQVSRDFTLLFVGQIVSVIGSQLTLVAVPYQVYSETHSSFQVGAVSLAQLVPLVVLSLVGGTVSDVMDRRLLLLLSFLALGATSAVLAVNAALAHPSLVVLYVVSAISAGLTGFSNPARSAVVPSLVSVQHLVAAFSYLQVESQVGTVIGPALSGLVIAGIGLPWAYGIDAVTFLVAVAAVFAMAPMPPAAGAPPAGWRSVVDGLRYLRGRQAIQGAYLIDINAMVLGMPRALFPAMAAEVFHGGAATLGVLYAAPGAGALLGALGAGWVERIRRQGLAVTIAVMAWGAAIAIFGLVSSLAWALVFLALAGWADVISAVLRNAMVLTAVPDEYRGRLSSFQMAVVTSGPRLGDLEAGTVASLVGTEVAVVSGGLACIVGALAMVALLPGFRHQRAALPGEVGEAGEVGGTGGTGEISEGER